MGTPQEGLRRRLLGLGFDAVRFASLAVRPPDGLSPWLKAGMHGQMAWMERTAAKRLDPGLVLEGARSAILLGLNYLGEAPRGTGPEWARYSLHKDYHDSVKPALQAAGRILEEETGARPEDYRYYVDAGPVLERAWAGRAGLGFIGKNAMLISREHGNWLLLAAILCRREFEPDPPIRLRGRPEEVGLLCGKCTRCMDACPTQAFAGPGVVDARRCISYLSIEYRGIIPRELRPGFGRRVFGCDACLEVCPWNRFARRGRGLILEAALAPAALSLAELLVLTPGRFAEVFKGTAVKRLKLAGLLRNACIAAGNSADRSLEPALLGLASHAAAPVRAHAVGALRRLGCESRLAPYRAAEQDPLVREEYEASLP